MISLLIIMFHNKQLMKFLTFLKCYFTLRNKKYLFEKRNIILNVAGLERAVKV